ncbi:MAG TPA: PQQ-binding-like beta-propeller repeat protein [Sandaracinaceae bacterium LLY-WYZ-13_1]|nr:PQQ-binding-like beta-propeller repeat protein [Sandaracinaceae bacterium LLY-WYZ-13_1]
MVVATVGVTLCGGLFAVLVPLLAGGGGGVLGSRARPAHGPCRLADLDGDGVDEIGALVHHGDYEHQRAAVYDGATGQERWSGEPGSGGETGLLCAGPSHLVMKPGPEFRVRVYEAADGAVHELPVPDQAIHWARGDGCFVVHTSDGSGRGFGLSPVAGSPCEATEPRRPVWRHPSYAEPSAFDDYTSVTTSFGDDRYRLWFRERGTELVRVSHGADWTRELSAVGVPHSERAAPVAVPGGVVVFTGPFPEVDATALVLRLDARTGETQWERRIEHDISVNLNGAVYNGRYVVALLGTALYAFDPANGEIAWQLGR